jgi:hypothetical protein
MHSFSSNFPYRDANIRIKGGRPSPRQDILTLNKEVISYMMNCPNCGAVMVWLNGSVLHEPPVNQYECRRCQIFVVKYADGDYEIISTQPDQQLQ